jgi:transposase InsO family protein
VSKERVIVLTVLQQRLSKAETARRYQVSWRWVHILVTRYQTGGWEAVEARSRRPHSNSRAVTAQLRERICTLRGELQTAGLDHGPVSIAARLQQEGIRPPAASTIRRVLTAAGLISPEPKKRPTSSYRRFQADQPNECWQSDFTHWQLADGTGVEIINWLDDHSRYLLASRAYRRVTGQTVITTFLAAVDRHGLPESTLTDNGSVYTSRFTGGRNGFEYLLASLGIMQKNGHPGHPQNPRQDRTLPPNPKALARRATSRRHHRRTANPAGHLHRHLQPHPASSCPPRRHPRPRLYRYHQGHPSQPQQQPALPGPQ